MKVFGYKDGKPGELMEIEYTLQAEQEFVDGYIECVGIVDNLVLVCNEDGKFRNLQPSCIWVNGASVIDIIRGNAFVCRSNIETSEMEDVEDEDIPKIRKYLKDIK